MSLVERWDCISFYGIPIKALVRSPRGAYTDWSTFQSVAVNDEYNIKDISFKDGDVIIVLGAFVGATTLLLATLNKNLKIYAYEPLPQNFEMLKKNIELNECDNVYISPLAVSDKKEKLTLYWKDPWFGNTSVEKDFVLEKIHSVEVDTTTLEEIFKEHNIQKCRLIKSDIEGKEKEILENCPPRILEKIDYFIGEHHAIRKRDLYAFVKDIFDDIPCYCPACKRRDEHDSHLGHFWFKNKKVK